MTEKEYSTAEKLDFAKIPPYPRQIASYSPQIMSCIAENQTLPRYEYFLGQALNKMVEANLCGLAMNIPQHKA